LTNGDSPFAAGLSQTPFEISPWLDGSNYLAPKIRKRIGFFEEGSGNPRCFEARSRLLRNTNRKPALYPTRFRFGDGFLPLLSASPRLGVIDAGTPRQAQNIEQIVAWLLHHKMIGVFIS
jgi:hypothetical protein